MEMVTCLTLIVGQILDLQLEPITIFLSLISGIVVGFSLGLMGGGGSILAVPLLIYVVGLSPHLSFGTSALSVAVNAITNLIQHKKNGHVKIRKGLVFAIPGAAGAFFGAQLGLLTPSNHLLVLFGLFMIGIAIFMLRHKHTAQNVIVDNFGTMQKMRLVITGLFVGVAAGYFGIGGGFLIAPTLIYIGGLGILDAIGTSLLPVSVFGLTTASRYAMDGQINLIISALFIVGGVGGGMLGTRLSTKIPIRKLAKLFAILLISVAIYVIMRSISF